jgi:hypothetical protein
VHIVVSQSLPVTVPPGSTPPPGTPLRGTPAPGTHPVDLTELGDKFVEGFDLSFDNRHGSYQLLEYHPHVPSKPIYFASRLIGHVRFNCPYASNSKECREYILYLFGELYRLLPSEEGGAMFEISYDKVTYLCGLCEEYWTLDYIVVAMIQFFLRLPRTSSDNTDRILRVVFGLATFLTKRFKADEHSWAVDLSLLWSVLLDDPFLRGQFVQQYGTDNIFKDRFLSLLTCFGRDKCFSDHPNLLGIDKVSHLQNEPCIRHLYDVLTTNFDMRVILHDWRSIRENNHIHIISTTDEFLPIEKLCFILKERRAPVPKLVANELLTTSTFPPSSKRGRVVTEGEEKQKATEISSKKTRLEEERYSAKRPHDAIGDMSTANEEFPTKKSRSSGDTKLEDEFEALVRRYWGTLRNSSGCGERSQKYVDNAHERIVEFAKHHPEFEEKVPRKETLRDDGACGAGGGFSTIWDMMKKDKEEGREVADCCIC